MWEGSWNWIVGEKSDSGRRMLCWGIVVIGEYITVLGKGINGCLGETWSVRE